MDINPLLKYVMKAKKADVVHSSGYAKAQNAGGIGAAGTSSFEQRMKIEGNRAKIKGYRDSAIASGAINMRPKAAAYTPPEPDAGTIARPTLGPKPEAPGSSPTLGPKPAPMPPRNPGISR